MGIKGLNKLITKYSPLSISTVNLVDLKGKKIAIHFLDIDFKMWNRLCPIYHDESGRIFSHFGNDVLNRVDNT